MALPSKPVKELRIAAAGSLDFRSGILGRVSTAGAIAVSDPTDDALDFCVVSTDRTRLSHRVAEKRTHLYSRHMALRRWAPGLGLDGQERALPANAPTIIDEKDLAKVLTNDTSAPLFVYRIELYHIKVENPAPYETHWGYSSSALPLGHRADLIGINGNSVYDQMKAMDEVFFGGSGSAGREEQGQERDVSRAQTPDLEDTRQPSDSDGEAGDGRGTVVDAPAKLAAFLPPRIIQRPSRKDKKNWKAWRRQPAYIRQIWRINRGIDKKEFTAKGVKRMVGVLKLLDRKFYLVPSLARHLSSSMERLKLPVTTEIDQAFLFITPPAMDDGTLVPEAQALVERVRAGTLVGRVLEVDYLLAVLKDGLFESKLYNVS